MRTLVRVSTLGLLLGMARPAFADGCPGPASDRFDVRDTPLDGVVLVQTFCGSANCFAGELPTELEITDLTSSSAIAGAIVRVDGQLSDAARIAWRPDAPLIEGHEYRVEWQLDSLHGGAQVDATFVALPALTWSAEDLVISPALELVSTLVKYFDCRPSMRLGTCSEIARVPLVDAIRPSLAVTIERSTLGVSDLDAQIAVTAEFWTSDDALHLEQAVDWRDPLASAAHRFEGAASAYCYHVEITSLHDGSMQAAQGCVEHGDLGTVGDVPRSKSEVEGSWAFCATRRPGDLAPWCAALRALCEGADPDAAELSIDCSPLDLDCSSSNTTTDVPADAAMDGASSQADAAMDGASSPEAESSCAVRTGARETHAPHVLILLGAVLALRRRRAV